MNRTMSQTETKTGFRASFSQLRQAQKARKGVPLYLLWINRPAGRVVAASLGNTRVRPNHVTFAGAVLTYGALLWVAFAAEAGPAAALVWVPLALGYVLDSADGQLARLQGRSSAYGEWVDHVLDNGRIAVMHVAVFCFLLRNTNQDPVLLAAGVGTFLLASSTLFFGGALLDQLRRNVAAAHGRTDTAAADTTASGTARRRMMRRSIITLPVDYGVTCLAFLFLPLPEVFLWLYAGLAAAHALMCAAFLPKWRSELLRLG